MSGGVTQEEADEEFDHEDDTNGVTENGSGLPGASAPKKTGPPCPYEEIGEFQAEVHAEVEVVHEDVNAMKEQLSTLQADLREQTAAMAQALRECRPRRFSKEMHERKLAAAKLTSAVCTADSC